MTPETLRWLLIAFAVWTAACTIKAALALKDGGGYRFAMWDGGLLRVGKVLTRRGTQTKLVLLPLLGLSCVLVLVDVERALSGSYYYGLLVLAAASVVSDLVQTEA